MTAFTDLSCLTCELVLSFRYLKLNHKPRLAVEYLPEGTISELRHLIDGKSPDEPAPKLVLLAYSLKDVNLKCISPNTTTGMVIHQ